MEKAKTMTNLDSSAAYGAIEIREIARRLNAALGATLVAFLAGSKDPRISNEWASTDGPEPPQDVARRLRFAHNQWLAITASEGEQVARMWFVGSNPRLDHDTPLNAIREARFQEAAAAAVTMVEDGFSS